MSAAQAAGLTHIGYGPLKRENQDSICIEENGWLGPGKLYGVFDGHGSLGKPISQRASQMLPHFLGLELKQLHQVGARSSACSM